MKSFKDMWHAAIEDTTTGSVDMIPTPLKSKSKKKKEQLMKDPKSLGEQVYRNYLRNQKMIDLINNQCPKHVKEEIRSSFESQNKNHLKNGVMNYFIKGKCVRLLEDLDDFIQ